MFGRKLEPQVLYNAVLPWFSSVFPFASDKAFPERYRLLEKTSTRRARTTVCHSAFLGATGLYVSNLGMSQASQGSLTFRSKCRTEGSRLITGHLLVACHEIDVGASENLEGLILHIEGATFSPYLNLCFDDDEQEL